MNDDDETVRKGKERERKRRWYHAQKAKSKQPALKTPTTKTTPAKADTLVLRYDDQDRVDARKSVRGFLPALLKAMAHAAINATSSSERTESRRMLIRIANLDDTSEPVEELEPYTLVDAIAPE